MTETQHPPPIQETMGNRRTQKRKIHLGGTAMRNLLEDSGTPCQQNG